MYAIVLGQVAVGGLPSAVMLAIISGVLVSLVALVVSVRLARRIREIGGPIEDAEGDSQRSIDRPE